MTAAKVSYVCAMCGRAVTRDDAIGIVRRSRWYHVGSIPRTVHEIRAIAIGETESERRAAWGDR